MLDRLDDLLGFHQQALRLRGERQQVLASNIANADTPNYKARDFDFQSALAGAIGNQATAAQLATTAPAHLAGYAGATLTGTPLQYRTPAQDAADGNTVNLDAERAAFAENALRYEFNLTRINQQIKGLLAAIQG